MLSEQLRESVKSNEGLRLKPYRCPTGFLTIGYGTNLEYLEIDEEIAGMLMDRELEHCRLCLWQVPGFFGLDAVRRDALTEMAYQLGVRGCLGFPKMWAAVRARDWQTVGKEARDSKWWRVQTRGRAELFARRMETGQWTPSAT